MIHRLRNPLKSLHLGVILLSAGLCFSACATQSQTQPEQLAMQNKFQSFEETLKAAEQGDAEAQYHLALKYANGEGVEPDHAKGFEWMRKSAEQGDPAAQFSLYLSYERGLFVKRDQAQAAQWFEKANKGLREAAERGDAGSHVLFYMGQMYEEGIGVERDDIQAAEWYLKAAKKAHRGAMFRLGLMYGEGRGVSKDSKQAAEWMQKSAELDHVGAMSRIGAMYMDGYGVERDFDQAAKWLCKAVDKHSGPAYELLMRICAFSDCQVKTLGCEAGVARAIEKLLTPEKTSGEKP